VNLSVRALISTSNLRRSSGTATCSVVTLPPASASSSAPAVVRWSWSNYCYYMASIKLKVARIGNSRGVRIPATTLERYQIADTVVMEERADGILLRPPGPATPRLSWEETAREMAAAGEDWSAWDVAVADGLKDVPWETVRRRRVAEPVREYKSRGRRKK
jgi:antitoxin component of MazEF toxin-antitoxin module